MEHRQSLKRQAKSQIVAQAWVEALRKSARRKSIPAATGFGTGTTIPMPLDRNPFNKTSQFLGECHYLQRKWQEDLEVNLGVRSGFPKASDSGWEGKKISFWLWALRVPSLFPLIPQLNYTKRSFLFRRTFFNQPSGQTPLKPDVKSTHVGKKRTLDKTDSKMSPRNGKEVKHVTLNSLVIRK